MTPGRNATEVTFARWRRRWRAGSDRPHRGHPIPRLPDGKSTVHLVCEGLKLFRYGASSDLAGGRDLVSGSRIEEAG